MLYIELVNKLYARHCINGVNRTTRHVSKLLRHTIILYAYYKVIIKIIVWLGYISGLVDDGVLSDIEEAAYRRTCTNQSVYEGCTTIPLIPGIGLGENTVCYCSTDYCNVEPISISYTPPTLHTRTITCYITSLLCLLETLAHTFI